MGFLSRLRGAKQEELYHEKQLEDSTKKEERPVEQKTEAQRIEALVKTAVEIDKARYEQRTETPVQKAIEIKKPEKEMPKNRTGEYDFTFKLILLGDGGVGKTTLFERYISNKFVTDTKMTIGVAPQVKYLKGFEFEENKYDVALQLWDIGGQERFGCIRPSFYIGARGALLVYDVTRYGTFDNLNNWLKEFNEAVGYKIPIIILGNKTDDVNNRNVKREDAEAYIKGKFRYFETSAKTGENVEKAFTEITKEMIIAIRKK